MTGNIVKFTPSTIGPESEMSMNVGSDVANFLAICLDFDCPCWCKPSVGTDISTIADHVSWLLVKRTDGTYSIYAPIPGENQMHLLAPSKEKDCVAIRAEYGDPNCSCVESNAVYTISGKKLSKLIKKATAEFLRVLPHATARLRKDKALPDYIGGLGWCTWNAFYKDVTAEGVHKGLQQWKDAGLTPHWMILDDGWQQVKKEDGVGDILCGLDANDKFPKGLSGIATDAKSLYGVGKFFVWHAVLGYWNGVDVDTKDCRIAPRKVESYRPMAWNKGVYKLPANPENFYSKYHEHIRECGVDGVKIDNQYSLISLGPNGGGRAGVFRRFRKAMEKSVQKNFGTNFITCMTANPEALYVCKSAANLFRGSDDFFPGMPDKHGRHIYQNALMGLWFGQFAWVDWDMFTTDDPSVQFHAAARAISGGPVYTADKPDHHDFAIFDKLLLSGRRIPRCLEPAYIAESSLFYDPRNADAGLLKVVNSTECGKVMGIFNCKWDAKRVMRTSDKISISDLGVRGDWAMWLHSIGVMKTLTTRSRVKIALKKTEAEVASFVEIPESGIAVFGLKRLFNPTGSITALQNTATTASVEVLDEGEVLAFARKRPSAVEFAGKSLVFDYDEVSSILTFKIPSCGRVVIKQ